MVEVKINMSFWEWFQTICLKNKIDLDTPIVDETIDGKQVSVTPRQFYEWFAPSGDDVKDIFTKLSYAHDDDGSLREFWMGYIRNSYEFGVPIVSDEGAGGN